MADEHDGPGGAPSAGGAALAAPDPLSIAPDVSAAPARRGPSATRSSLQLGRRAFHMLNGVAAASAYALLFTHKQAVYLLGTIACLVYLLDQIRLKYPELMRRGPWIERALLRAEEQFKESAMIPYAIAILLTIITFPKDVALIAIYTLAIADPLSAVVGITLGRRSIVPGKTLEGSGAFFAATFAVAALVLHYGTGSPLAFVLSASFAIAVLAAAIEMMPLRLDDNLTIPIFVGFVTWICTALFGISLR